MSEAKSAEELDNIPAQQQQPIKQEHEEESASEETNNLKTFTIIPMADDDDGTDVKQEERESEGGNESGVDSDKSSSSGDDNDVWFDEMFDEQKSTTINMDALFLSPPIEQSQAAPKKALERNSPNKSMCETISRLKFTPRFNPPWAVDSKFLEPTELPGIMQLIQGRAPLATDETSTSTTTDDSLDFNRWCHFSESENPERRQAAANAIALVTPCVAEEEFSNGPLRCRNEGRMGTCFSKFFKEFEHLAWDIFDKKEIIPALYKQIPFVADYLKSSSMLDLEWEQFNMRIPSQLVRMVLDGMEHRKIALFTLEQLIEDGLIKSEVVQNIIVPGLFFYLQEAHAINCEDPERYKLIPLVSDGVIGSGAIFSIFAKILTVMAESTSPPKLELDEEWMRKDFIPHLLEFFIDPQLIPVPKTQDLCPIREIFAQCLAPMAKLMEKDGNAVDAQLLPIFQRFLRDTPEVQCAALKQLADFCTILSAESREQLLRELGHLDLSQMVIVNHQTRFWRQRAEFAEQLTKMVHLFPVSLVNTHICPFALTFAADRVSSVRTNGAAMLAAVLGSFIQAEWATPSPAAIMPLTDQLLDEIRTGFWRTRDWRRRQSFGRLLYQLLVHNYITENQFCRLFHEDMANLSNDPIANVRQYFCLLAQLNKFAEKPSVGPLVSSRLEQMGEGMATMDEVDTNGGGFIRGDPDLEIRTLANIALGRLDPEKMGLDLTGRAERLAAN